MTDENSDETRLREAVAELYDTFSSVRKPRHISDDLAVYTDEQLRAQKTKTLREFTLEEMTDYTWHSFYCEGQERQAIRYWLPRLLDVFSTVREELDFDTPAFHPVFDIDLLTDRMQATGWSTWDLQERAVITKWLLAWFQACLEYGGADDAWPEWLPENRKAFGSLLAMQKLGMPFGEALKAWNGQDGLPPVRQLVDLVGDLAMYDDLQEKLGLASPNAADRTFATWLFLETTQARLESTRDAVLEQGLRSASTADIYKAERIAEETEQAMAELTALRAAHADS